MIWVDKRPIELRKAIVEEVKKYVKKAIVDFWLGEDTYNFTQTLITPHNIARIFEKFHSSYQKKYIQRRYTADPNGIMLNENSDLDNIRVYFAKDQITTEKVVKHKLFE